jgi:polysaccharide chain length determinant protein (PEP-CTERM system associated)
LLGHRPLKVSDFGGILKRRALWLIVPSILLSVVALGISFTLSPRYVSQTLVLIEGQKVPDDYVKPVVTTDIDERLGSMKEQILSRSRIQPIVERFNLYPGAKMDERLDAVRKNIDIKPIRSEISHAGGLPGFYILFTAGDARTAQQVCSEITSLFIGNDLRSRAESAQGTTDFLESQLTEAKANLDAQDAKMADFQRKYLGKLPGQQAPNLDMLTSLNTQLQAATQQLATMETNRAYMESMLASQTHDVVAGTEVKSPSDDRQAQLTLLEAEQADLSARYTPDYPDVIAVKRKIADLKSQMKKPATTSSGGPAAVAAEPAGVQQLHAGLRALDAGINAKRAEQQQIQNNVKLYQDRISSSPLVEEEYKALTRDYQTAQKFYDDLLAKMNQSKMATSLERRQQGEQFSVVDAASLPDSPSFPKRGYFAAGGFALGLLVGVVISALLEYRNTAIRTEDDVYAFLRLNTLGVIERVGANPSKQIEVQSSRQLELPST